MKKTLLFTLTFLIGFTVAYSQLATDREIFNNIWDRANNRLMTTPWAGAQGSFETTQAILNNVWNRSTNSLNVSGAQDITITEEELLAFSEENPCTPFTQYRVIEADESLNTFYRCNPAGTGVEKTAGGTSEVAPSTTGLETDPTTVVAFKPKIITLNQNAPLCKHFNINVETGTEGVVLTLPFLTDTTCSRWFTVSLESGTAPFTLATRSGEFINNDKTTQAFDGAKYAFAWIINQGVRWKVLGTSQSQGGSFFTLAGNNTLTGNNIFNGTSTFNDDAIFTNVFTAISATEFKIRKGAGLLPTAEAELALNTTTYVPSYGDGSVNRLIYNGGFWGQDTSASNIVCTNPGPTVRYSPPFGTTLSATDSTSRRYAPEKRRLRNFYAKFGAVPAGQTLTLTLRINGSPGTVTCPATATQTSCSDTTHTDEIAAGDGLQLQIECGGGTTAFGPIDWGVGAY